jgi:hypothetical protein
VTISFQGFSIENNLLEAEADRTILNNLSGAPIGDDLSLLFNNNRNVSSLTITPNNIVNDTIIISDAQAIFSNKTAIQVGNETYYIKNSNGQNSFKLATLADLSDTVSNPPQGIYIRSDAVTFDNITNFSIIRRNTDVNRVDTDTQLDSSTSARRIFLQGATVRQSFESLERNLDSYNFKKSKSLKINSNFFSEKRIESSGVNVITDIDNINSEGLTDQSPGLFIYNVATNSGIRAFSSSDNPWSFDSELDPSNLIVDTSAISIKELVFNTTELTLNSKSQLPTLIEAVSPQSIQSNFTHTIPVTINNETYFLCLNLES